MRHAPEEHRATDDDRVEATFHISAGHSVEGTTYSSSDSRRRDTRPRPPNGGTSPSTSGRGGVADDRQATCRPHSVLPLPAQRPARASSPLPAARVHGVHPIDGIPAIVQLVVRNAVLEDVAPAVALAPVDQRLHLDDAAAGVEHELREPARARSSGRGGCRSASRPRRGSPARAARPCAGRSSGRDRAPRARRRASPPAPRRSAAGAASRPRARSGRRAARAWRASRGTAGPCRSRRGASRARPGASCAPGSTSRAATSTSARDGRRRPRRRTRRAPRRAAARSAGRGSRPPRRSDRRRAGQSAHTHPSNQSRLSQPEGALMRAESLERVVRAAAPGRRRRARAPSGRPCQSDPPAGTRSSRAHSRERERALLVVVVGAEALDRRADRARRGPRRSARARRRPCAACTDARAPPPRRSPRRARRPPPGRASPRPRRPADRRRAGGRRPPAASPTWPASTSAAAMCGRPTRPFARRATSSHSIGVAELVEPRRRCAGCGSSGSRRSRRCGVASGSAPGRGQVGEQVHRARGRPHRDLGAGDEAHAEAVRRRGRLGQAGERVVVGQRERADAERVRVLDQRRGRERPVGGRRMAVEIEASDVEQQCAHRVGPQPEP